MEDSSSGDNESSCKTSQQSVNNFSFDVWRSDVLTSLQVEDRTRRQVVRIMRTRSHNTDLKLLMRPSLSEEKHVAHFKVKHQQKWRLSDHINSYCFLLTRWNWVRDKSWGLLIREETVQCELLSQSTRQIFFSYSTSFSSSFVKFNRFIFKGA